MPPPAAWRRLRPATATSSTSTVPWSPSSVAPAMPRTLRTGPWIGLMTASCWPSRRSTSRPRRRSPRPDARRRRGARRAAAPRVRTPRAGGAARAARRAGRGTRGPRCAGSCAAIDEQRLEHGGERNREALVARRRRSAHWMIASVIGSVNETVVPRPTSRLDVHQAAERRHVLAHHVHADAATARLGDLLRRRETGREDQLERLACATSSRVALDQPERARRARARAAGSMPRPSSRDLRSPRGCRAGAPRCGSQPSAGLPAATRSSGGSMAWSKALRTTCISGSTSSSTISLSSSVSAPRMLEAHVLAELAAQPPHHARQLLEDLAQRHHAHVEHAGLEIARAGARAPCGPCASSRPMRAVRGIARAAARRSRRSRRAGSPARRPGSSARRACGCRRAPCR